MNYIQILNLSADSPEQLRRTDVERVLEEAYKQDCYRGFREYLLNHKLHQDTREQVARYTKEIFESEVLINPIHAIRQPSTSFNSKAF